MPLLAILFLVVPIAELAVIVQVAGAIGIGETILVLVAVSVIGAWLCKREGLNVLRRIESQLQRGELPSRELADGGLILLAGALLLTPGFISDVFGILLLLPPTRAIVRGPLVRAFRRRSVYVSSRRTPGGQVYDVRSRDAGRPPDPGPPSLDR